MIQSSGIRVKKEDEKNWGSMFADLNRLFRKNKHMTEASGQNTQRPVTEDRSQTYKNLTEKNSRKWK